MTSVVLPLIPSSPLSVTPPSVCGFGEGCDLIPTSQTVGSTEARGTAWPIRFSCLPGTGTSWPQPGLYSTCCQSPPTAWLSSFFWKSLTSRCLSKRSFLLTAVSQNTFTPPARKTHLMPAFSPLKFLIEVKVTRHKMSRLKVQNSGAFSAVAVLCGPHLDQAPK